MKEKLLSFRAGRIQGYASIELFEDRRAIAVIKERNNIPKEEWADVYVEFVKEANRLNSLLGYEPASTDAKSVVIRRARSSFKNQWPEQLDSGVMFFEGTRITISEFNKSASQGDEPCHCCGMVGDHSMICSRGIGKGDET